MCQSWTYLLQDYKTYLDFVLAMENRREPQALRYLFRILDVQHKGYLNVFALNYFFRVCCVHQYRHYSLLQMLFSQSEWYVPVQML